MFMFPLQLEGTLFENMVCPLFGHYSRYYQTLQSLPEGDSRHTNISLITVVSEKLAEASCKHVSVLYQHLYLLVRSVYLDLSGEDTVL